MSYPVHAYCFVSPAGKPCHVGAPEVPCNGWVYLTQEDETNCRIQYEVAGLTPGSHGFHIHETSDFSNGCVSAGPHYNPFGKTHGAPEDEERHVGDLGNITPGPDGVAAAEIHDSQIKLFGPFSVIGRSFMIHADSDDLGRGGHETSKTTGNAGSRIACGEIKTFPIRAECVLGPGGKPCSADAPPSDVRGVVRMVQVDPTTCEIEYEIAGLSAGEHGFHVHEKADFSQGCVSAGPHYNPFGKTHGAQDDAERHVGDLGNVTPDSTGFASGRLTDSLIKLFGPYSVVGRSFMVHADRDDLGRGGHDLSKTTGNAGARLACGEIKLV